MGYNRGLGFSTDIALGIGGLVSSIAQSEALSLQGQYAEKISEMNARFAEMEAKDVVEAGDKAASEHGRKINQMIGAQKAGFAAGNVKVGSGTAAIIQKQTREIGFDEQRAIRNNAWREAFGLKTQAFNYRAQGSAEKQRYSAEAQTTLITGGLKFAKGLSESYHEYYGQNNIKTEDLFDPADVARKESKAEMTARTA